MEQALQIHLPPDLIRNIIIPYIEDPTDWMICVEPPKRYSTRLTVKLLVEAYENVTGLQVQLGGGYTRKYLGLT